MSLEMFQLVLGLALGLGVALFHRPIGDFMLEQERSLDFVFRSRGLNLPPPPTQGRSRDLYFFMGISLALIQVARLWLTLRP